ncbi:M20 family metallopeptidase [Pseudomonas sp. NPDC087346]|uniref:M20 family metallopeptidase n=1 Tax=Pseudomonas sp. NPDC087346 TaxID=3364438 RepID=UPI00380FBEC5
MSKSEALANSRTYLSDGRFEGDLRRRVAIESDSQSSAENPALAAYLVTEIVAHLSRLGFTCELMENPEKGCPLLFAQRHESDELHTVLSYGHGDVVPGHAEQWGEGRSPWQLSIEGDHWYGRGTADNKGQHSINLAALESVISARNGKLGFNIKMLFETGEECGSPGLREFCTQHKELLHADVFLASDGPRLNARRPTLFLGSRGSVIFSLEVQAREQALHSGNWGGVMMNPAIVLANAISALVDSTGRIKCAGLLPSQIPDSVRQSIADLEITKNSLGRELDEGWGEPGLSLGEKLFGWNTLEVLAMTAGNPQRPVNAIPSKASAFCQLRFVVGTKWEQLESAVREHLDNHGFEHVQIKVSRSSPATRLDPDHHWAKWASCVISMATSKKIAVIPNLAGTLPNDIFANVLELPTLWIPHSYPGCSQHAPNEHALSSIIEEGLEIMTHVFWELGAISVKK